MQRFYEKSAPLADSPEKLVLAFAIAIIMTVAVFFFWRSARARRLVEKVDEVLEDVVDGD